MNVLEKETAVIGMDEKDLDGLSRSGSSPIAGETTETIYIDPEAERAVIKKFDKYVLPQAFLFVLLNFLDRSNLGNARVFGFEKDLGLVGNQFGDLVTLFFLPYILAEVFWVTAVKRFEPNYVITVALFGWCAATIATGFVHNYGQVLACRLFLGLFEAGVAPSFTF